MRSITSAFWAKLQEDAVVICELIEFDLGVAKYYWTSANKHITCNSIVYEPFPGQSGSGIEESTDLGVSVVDFVISNSGNSFVDIISATGVEFGDLYVRRVFVDTPDLGSMSIYRGRVGDYSWDRNQLKGQARNAWNSADVDWPPYTYMDGCAWRFGSNGCGFNTSSITVNSLAVASVSADNRTIYVNSGTFTASGAVGVNFYDRGRCDVMTGNSSGQARAIFAQSGDSLQMYASFPGRLQVGDVFSIRPGCRKRFVQDCHSKYNNTSSYLGFPWMPGKDNAF